MAVADPFSLIERSHLVGRFAGAIIIREPQFIGLWGLRVLQWICRGEERVFAIGGHDVSDHFSHLCCALELQVEELGCPKEIHCEVNG
jgi:hypothetical protein